MSHTLGIEYFLTQCVQNPDKHPREWDWHVLDSERIHQDILQILFNNSPEFGHSLFGMLCDCTRQPESGLFDLLLVAPNAEDEIYIEIKCDQKWGTEQRRRQIEFLRQRPKAKCAMLLLSLRAATITRLEIQGAGDQFFKITYRELYKALAAINQDVPEFVELANGYRLALQQQEQRTRDRFGNPDA